MKTLRLLLGDQLNIKHSWFKEPNKNVVYCMFEMRQETDYVVHHIQKVIGFFAAMRQFSETIASQQHQIIYFKIDDSRNMQNLPENLKLLIEKHHIENFEYQSPHSYRLDTQLTTLCKTLSIPSKVFSTEHFYTQRYDLDEFFKGKK